MLRHAAPLAAGLVERMHRRAVANAALRRFRDFAEISGDWLWETDAEHRFTYLENLSNGSRSERPDQLLGMTRWQLAGSSLEERRWREHKADLDAHRPFSGLEQLRPAAPARAASSSPPAGSRFAADGVPGLSRSLPGHSPCAPPANARRDRRAVARSCAPRPRAFVVLDAEGHIGYANQRFAEMLGRSIEELGGAAMAPFVTDGAAFVAMIAEPPLRPVELELSRADGTTLSVMVSMRPMRAEGYDTDGTLVMLSDISAHKQAQASFRRATCATCLQSQPDVGGRRGEPALPLGQRRGDHRYGYSREEFSPCAVRHPPEDVARVADAISAGRRGGVELWRHRTKAGDPRCRGDPYRIVYEGKLAWLSPVRDAAEKRRAGAWPKPRKSCAAPS